MTAFGRNIVMPVSSFECLLRPIRMPKADRQETTQNRSFPATSLFTETCHAIGYYTGAAFGPGADCPVLARIIDKLPFRSRQHFIGF